MRIPDAVRSAAERALGRRSGRDVAIVSARPVGGGCISPSARVETDAGAAAFLKWGEGEDGPAAMFVEEARSLEALAEADAVRVPDVLGVSEERDAPAWLLLEWLEPGRPDAGAWERLGRALAALHRYRGERYGWPADNFIGSLPQPNGEDASWPTFWRGRRLEPQLRRAYDGGYFDRTDRRRFDALLDSLDAVLDGAGADGASLVHGDLWSGNVHVLTDGTPAVIDPAAYRGHREVDLAMSELFGGFGAGFYAAYEEAWPLESGYRERRRAAYQLYYLLVHVNLFGGGYVGRTLSALRSLT